ncbi:MAG TPA: ATP-binding protein [Polyangiaceae bacterium]|nr:ATP-binding protein [Polyangiaceae bacterium]
MTSSYLQGMEQLVGVVQELSRARDLPRVQEIVRKAARELTGADGATFVLRDGDRCFYADEDAIEPLWKGQRFPMSACISGWVMLHGKPAVIEDIYADARIPHEAYRPTFVKSLAMIPVRTESPIAAIGNYWATRRLPTDIEMKLLQALANSTSVALENAQLYAELEERIAQRSAALESARRAEAQALKELEERRRTQAQLDRTEAQLRQSQKMDAVGQLAGGIAHDFNNLLSVILSFSSMAREALPPGDPIRDDLSEVSLAGERAAALTKRLLTFSRQQIVEPRLVDVGEVTRGMEMMLRRLLGEHVELDVNVAPELFPVMADAGQLEQVLMNLAVNARDAMPDGGKLTIELGNVHLSGEYTNSYLGVSDGDYLMLAVSDTGSGMDRETQSRIFEPFFTTKPQGKGTGLGLSTVYGIVKQSGGHVWVYSEPGEGTTFKVYLPRGSGDAAVPRARPPLVVRLNGSETVLLVEDDEQVRKAARGILRRNGYEVVEATGASQAVEFAESGGRFDVLLTDVIMPQVGGMQLIERLRAVRPELRAVCMSGYAAEAALRHGLIERGIAFVQKPLTPEALLLKVREALEQAPIC